jgi:hypothetical protein
MYRALIGRMKLSPARWRSVTHDHHSPAGISLAGALEALFVPRMRRVAKDRDRSVEHRLDGGKRHAVFPAFFAVAGIAFEAGNAWPPRIGTWWMYSHLSTRCLGRAG